jgi:hypothetical protein
LWRNWRGVTMPERVAARMPADRSPRSRWLLSAQRRLHVVTAQRIPETAHARAQRFTHLGQSLGSEHEQQQNEQKSYVEWIVKTHFL